MGLLRRRIQRRGASCQWLDRSGRQGDREQLLRHLQLRVVYELDYGQLVATCRAHQGRDRFLHRSSLRRVTRSLVCETGQLRRRASSQLQARFVRGHAREHRRPDKGQEGYRTFCRLRRGWWLLGLGLYAATGLLWRWSPDSLYRGLALLETRRCRAYLL